MVRYSQHRETIFFTLSTVIALSISIYALQIYIDRDIPHPTSIEDLKYLPSGNFLKGAALSYDELLADILWIKAIGYFGGHAVTDQNYDWLYHILDITTTLDPLFENPYEFGGIVLATEVRDVDQSIAILKKGMENVPKCHKRYWYLPFFLAYDYMFYKADYLNAAHYLEMATQFPQSPRYLPLLVARLYANADDPEIAIAFLDQMIKSTDSKELKEKLAARIKEVMVDRDIRILEAARDQFMITWRRFPEDLNELVMAGLIPAIPKDPFGGRYHISSTDYSIQSSSMPGKLKLYINKDGQGPSIGLKQK